MGLLDFIGLGRRKARPVGHNLEKRRKGRQQETGHPQQNLVIKISIFLALILLTLLAFPRTELFEYTVQIDDIWRQEDLVAPFDFAIYKSSDEIEAERREVRYSTPPYFLEETDARAKAQAKRDTVANQLERILTSYRLFQFNKLRGRHEVATTDSLHYLETRRNARLILSPAQWDIITNAYAEQVPGLASSRTSQGAGGRLDEVLLEEAWGMLGQMINIGILDVPLDSVFTDQIIIRNEVESTQRRKNKDNVFGLNEAFTLATEQFQDLYPDRPELVQIGNAFFRAIFQHSLTYLRAETVRESQQKEDRIRPTRGMVSGGAVIVSKNQRVTEEIKRELTSLERAQNERSGNRLPWKLALGQFILTFATFLIFFLYLYVLRRQIFDDNWKVLLVALLFALVIGSFALALRYPMFGMYAVPVAIAPVMLTVMFDSRVALFGVITLALLGGHLSGYDFEFTFATMFACTLGVFSVRDIKNRGQIFLSAGIVFLGYLSVLSSTWLLYDTPIIVFGQDLLRVGINSLLLIISLPLLWVFERMFDITTDLTLLELSDTNRPLLKELSMRAPGTFSHTLQVANLAEAAADAIGANALLARVGALYHDIGKMVKPEYFVENQRPGSNPHDQLKPRMSALIIASHVKEGIELGKKHNLPRRVLNFIPMHHGTSLIEYFFRKASEGATPEEAAIIESEFRYPGPRPDSRETGILLLADSIEAASRSLTSPTHKRLESLIDSIFRARVEDGQLDETGLTFRELHQIKETFLSLLLGIYHVRVKYPGQEQEEKDTPTETGEEVILVPALDDVAQQEMQLDPEGRAKNATIDSNGGPTNGDSGDEAVRVEEDSRNA